MLDSCAECEREAERDRIWDPYARRYVDMGSGHDYVDGFDDDDGRRSDTTGRL